MPTVFQEIVINGSWDFYNFLEWNLAVWVTLFFGGPSPVQQQLYPPNMKEYILTCAVCSAGLSVFYSLYLCGFYMSHMIR